MPIKGISEVVRLPRLGKIRLGVKKEADGGSYPVPTDYFVCPDEVKGIYGERPQELKIMFPTEDESQWAAQYLKCYSATRGLICRGDGEVAIARVDMATGEIATRESTQTELREIACSPGNCPYYLRSQCRRVMNLQFLLPDCPGLGIYQLDTSSYHSIVNINSDIKLIKGICQRIAMIPLCLKLVKQEVQPQGRKKVVHVLTLTAPYTLAEIQRYAQIPQGQSLILPPPESQAPDDLFPAEVLGESESAEADELPYIDEALLTAYEQVKNDIDRLRLTEAQVSRWFQRCYQLDVSLKDFQPKLPPDKFTLEMLTSFGEALSLYEQRYKQKSG